MAAISHARLYALSETAFFHSLSPLLLQLRGLPAKTVGFEPGAVIFRENERGNAAFIILDGTVEITTAGPQGPERIAQLGAQMSLGECALFCNAPREATARALTHVNALQLSRDVFERLVMEYPSIGLEIIRTLGSRLSLAISRLRDMEPGAGGVTATDKMRTGAGDSILNPSTL